MIKKSTDHKVLSSFSLILAGFGYALYGPLSRIVGASFGPVAQILSRAGLRLVLILIVFFVTKTKLQKIYKEDLIWFFLISAMAAGTTLFYIPAVIKLPLGLTMFLFYALGTISSYIAGHFLFREKLTRGKAIALFFVIAGLAVTFADSMTMEKSIFLIFACLSGFFYGLYSPFSKKISHKYSLTQMILIGMIVEFFIYLATWFIFRDNLAVPGLTPWLANLFYAADVIVITYLVFYGFRHLEAQIGSLLLLSELIFILILGFVVYREVPTTAQFIGGAFIVLGMTVPQFLKN